MLRQFRPPAWAWLLTFAGVALFVTLGMWQVHRGLAKQHWLAQFQNDAAPALILSAQTPAAREIELQRAQASGIYLADRQLLQDGQARGGQPGVHVWTPLRLGNGSLLLVNRGWIPQPSNLNALVPPPAPEGELTVSGWWRSLPVPGIRAGGDECRASAQFPLIVVYPRLDQLQCLLGVSPLPGLLLLDAREPGGFVREWAAAGFPPERHFGYAVTWFGLGVTAVILFITLNLKRDDQTKN